MNDGKITSLTAIGSIDRTTDLLEIVDVSANASFKVTVNNLVGITGGSVLSTIDTQTVDNKTLNNTNLITLLDGAFTLQNNLDPTKQAVFSAATITTGQTRTFTFPDADTTLVGTGVTQTLTAKTLVNPILTLPAVADFSHAQHDHSSAAQGGIIAATGSGLALETNGTPNGNQALLNLVAGSGITLTDDLSGNISIAGGGGGGGAVLSIATLEDTSSTTGSTPIPYDNTEPQITEGDEFLSMSFTGSSVDSAIRIEVTAMLASSAITDNIIGAIFAAEVSSNAIANFAISTTAINQVVNMKLDTILPIGTSTYTISFRAGTSNSGTLTFNGAAGSGKFGTFGTKSVITITECIATINEE